MPKTIKKKMNNEKIKEEFSKSLRENDEVENTNRNIANVIEPGQAIGLIKEILIFFLIEIIRIFQWIK